MMEKGFISLRSHLEIEVHPASVDLRTSVGFKCYDFMIPGVLIFLGFLWGYFVLWKPEREKILWVAGEIPFAIVLVGFIYVRVSNFLSVKNSPKVIASFPKNGTCNLFDKALTGLEINGFHVDAFDPNDGFTQGRTQYSILFVDSIEHGKIEIARFTDNLGFYFAKKLSELLRIPLTADTYRSRPPRKKIKAMMSSKMKDPPRRLKNH